VAQPTYRIPLDFEAQTKKLSWWFWDPNHQIRAVGFEAQTGKPEVTSFVAKPGETVATSFETKPEKIVATDFEAKLEKTVTTGFEVKPEKTIPVVLKLNHSQTVHLGFDPQLRNPRYSSSRAWCRPHTVSPDLLIVRPPSTRPVWPSLIICTRSHTPAMILIAAHHAAPATCTQWDKQMWLSERNKDKGKNIKMSWIQIETSPNQWLTTIKPMNWPFDFSIILRWHTALNQNEWS
jgi:hypothetical protein